MRNTCSQSSGYTHRVSHKNWCFNFFLSWIFMPQMSKILLFPPKWERFNKQRGQDFFCTLEVAKLKYWRNQNCSYSMRHPLWYFPYCRLHYNYCIVMLIVVKGFKLCIAQCCSQVLMRRSIIPTFNNFRKLKTFFSQRFLLTLTHPSYLKIRIAVRNACFERHLLWGVNIPFLWFFPGSKVD